MATRNSGTTIIHKRRLQSEVEYASRQHWVYGFWFKNKLMRRVARKIGISWQGYALMASVKVINHVMRTARVECDMQTVTYRGKSVTIMAFVVDDERKLDGNKYSAKQMDAVRKAMGLPAGTKPRWYELCDRAHDPEGELDSEDEPLPAELKEGSDAVKYPEPEIPDEVVDAYIKLMF